MTDSLETDRYAELEARVNELELEAKRPKNKLDVAHLIAAALGAADSVTVECLVGENEGPMGGKSSQVLVRLDDPRGTHKFVVINIYDDDKIQKSARRLFSQVNSSSDFYTHKVNLNTGGIKTYDDASW